MIRLREWAVTGPTNPDPYMPPEAQPRRLNGAVFGHPRSRFADGDRVTTSEIVAADGRIVHTASGSTYMLDGEPAPAYVEYLAGIGYALDPENPIKVRR
jgi:hypothetical protein